MILAEEQTGSDEEEEKGGEEQQDNNIKLEFSEMIVFRSIKRKIDLRSFQSKKQLRLDSFIDICHP